ncbi:MAG TPA: hypothetical protein VEW03_05355, partial [Longimicrobiaceae bacterium]|nr:hypothetical protein [Longimicrobiaceae bacterium]
MAPLRTTSLPRLRRVLSGRGWWRALGLRAGTDEVDGYRIHAVEAGAGGETVVLLHGLSGSARWWQRNIPALAATRRVV